MDDSKLLPGLASIATFAIYHWFEPTSPRIHATLLFLLPGILASHFQPQFQSIVGGYLIMYVRYLSLILLFLVAYRISPFHPLAKYPGPIAAKISNLWLVYVSVRGDAHEAVRRAHEEYGEVIRVGPNELSFAASEAVHPILAMKLFKKGPYYDTRQQPSGTAMDGLRDWNEHSARRKPWSKAMSSAALKEYDPILLSKIHELTDCLGQRASKGEVIDMSTWMSFFSFDFMGRMVFNYDFGMMKASCDVDGFCHLLKSGTTVVAYISHVPWSLPLLNLIPGGSKEFGKLQDFTDEMAKERIQGGSETKDIYHYLTEEDSEGDTSVKAKAQADGMMAIIAGSDTSSTALSHVWYYLLRHPHYYQTLQKEVDHVFPCGEDPIDFKRHADMTFLNACINEALRLLPPVLSGLQRRVEIGTKGAAIANHFVPEGTQVSVHHYTLQRSPKHFFPMPNVFWPDRWLNQEKYTLPSGDVIDKDQLILDRTAFLPFSTGPQGCAGKNLAMMEMRALICAVVQRFDMEVADGFDLDSWEKNVHDIYISLTGSLKVKLKARA